MTNKTPDECIDHDRSMDEAAQWLIRGTGAAGSAERMMFEQWLDANPANRSAYQKLLESWDVLGDVKDDPKVQRWRREALEPRRYHFARPGPLVGVGMAIAASVALFFVWFAANRAMVPALSVFKTKHGQIRTVTLADGSHITLDTATELTVLLGKRERRVTLKSGQAFFDVVHDRHRPFVVRAGDREVLDVGTQFDVQRRKNNVAVLLLHGRVEVRGQTQTPPGTSIAPVRLSPGQRLQFTISEPASSITSVDVKAMTSWRTGRVHFDKTPLVEAVAEMNRYSEIPIRIVDRRLDRLQVSGVFRTTGTESFVTALTMSFPVEADDKADSIKLRWKARAN